MIALWCSLSAWSGGQVTVPIEVWQRARGAVATAPAAAPPSRVGAADWRGVADPETLTLQLVGTLQIDLGQGPGWRSVPLLGQDSVLVGVTVDGRPEPVGVADGHHTWRTDRRGRAVVQVRALVPAGGQGGALQYDVVVPSTASTHLQLDLPRPNLDPAVEGAIRTEVISTDGRTRLVADLVPTTRIKVLGLRDLGEASSREAKLYAEGVHLLSVDEHRLELFTVLHYSILYAGVRRFEAFLPEGLRVVSAGGEGAFRYTLTETEGGTLLQGQTTYPIHNRYEISLRLQRELPSDTFTVDLPHPLGVERAHGWVGVEVPGRVQLDTVDAQGLLGIDPLQLPDEVREASVSPILAAFRATGDRGRVRLAARPLPEVEVDADTIDRVWARTLVSANGRVATEIQFSLRNRLRHGLTLTLPSGTRIVRAQRDGQPIVPSRGDDERIVLPLRRTTEGKGLVVQVVLASQIDLPGWIGSAALALPEVDLPISELAWEVHWPEGMRFSELRGEVRSQQRSGSGHWLGVEGQTGGTVSAALAPPEAGSMAIYQRYWIPAGEGIGVSATHIARGLRALGTLAILGLGLVGIVAGLWRPAARLWARARSAVVTSAPGGSVQAEEP